MSTESQPGTYKRSTPEEVAYVVEEMRSHHGWKELALAHEARVTVAHA